MAEDKHKNRCLHEDQVYFKIVKQVKDKCYCSIVAIERRKTFQIVGRLKVLPWAVDGRQDEREGTVRQRRDRVGGLLRER